MAVSTRLDKEPQILKALRVDKSNTSYAHMSQIYRNDILQHTQSASEYLICYRLDHFSTRTAAAQQIKRSTELLRHWEVGNALPDAESLSVLMSRFFEANSAAAGRFGELVRANYRTLLATALQDSNYFRFGKYLSCTDARFALRELTTFLSALARPTETAAEESLIRSHSIYLHFLRHAAGISEAEAEAGASLSKGAVRNIESPRVARNQNYRERLETYLEARLAERIKQWDEPERSLVATLLDLLANPEIKRHVADFSETARRPASPGRSL